MDQEVARKIVAVQDQAGRDPKYLELLKEHEVLDRKFQEALRDMRPELCDAVMDYMGLFTAMHLRLLELACSIEYIGA